MVDCSLHKFDLKGNLIKESISMIKGVLNEFPYGIETDGVFFYITYGDPTIGTVRVYQYTKKFTEVRSFSAPSTTNSRGITTNGKHLVLSRSTAALDTIDKKGNSIRAAVATTNTAYPLSFNGKNILAPRSGSVTMDLLDPSSFTVTKSIALGVSAFGVCHMKDFFCILASDGATIWVYDYKGNLIRKITLPIGGGTIVYRDLCYDHDYWWILSFPVLDVDPPIE